MRSRPLVGVLGCGRPLGPGRGPIRNLRVVTTATPPQPSSPTPIGDPWWGERGETPSTPNPSVTKRAAPLPQRHRERPFAVILERSEESPVQQPPPSSSPTPIRYPWWGHGGDNPIYTEPLHCQTSSPSPRNVIPSEAEGSETLAPLTPMTDQRFHRYHDTVHSGLLPSSPTLCCVFPDPDRGPMVG